MLHSVHVKGRDFRTVEDRFRPLALAMPWLWAMVEGLWITGTALLALFVALPFLGPAGSIAWLALALIAGLEGGSLIRLELRLLGWKEAALALAATSEGAEELWLEGRALRTGAP